MRHDVRSSLSQFSGRPALVFPRYAGTVPVAGEVTSNSLLADLIDLSKVDPAVAAAVAADGRAVLLSTYGFEVDPTTQAKPFAFADGKAIIPIHGALLNRFNSSYSFATGYNFIRSQLAAAMADPDVDGIIYDVNSNGGSCAGCPETGQMIYAASESQGGKPSMAVIDANGFSAAYWLASAADQVVAVPSGSAGSIGVVLMHVDLSKALEDMGIKVTFIHAGDHKVDGNPVEPLSKEVKAAFQAEVDKTYDGFVAAVAQGRNMDEKAVRDTEADIFLAADALKLGLIDAVQTPDNAVEAFFGQRSSAMTTRPNTTQAAAADPKPEVVDAEATANAARTAERTRISGIQTHAEAEGRAALAAHLALGTDLSVEVAAGILAKAPKEAKAEPKAAEPTETSDGKNGSHFKNAMDNGSHPNVGAGSGSGGTSEDTQTPAQRILAAQGSVMGRRQQGERAN